MSVVTSAVLITPGCTNKSAEGLIILTQVRSTSNPDYISGDSWRYIEQTTLSSFDPSDPKKNPLLLTGEFYSACSPKISYDGKSMLFTAQAKQGEPWQIWEMNLLDSKVTQIISTEFNCADPNYLPGKRIVFSGYHKNDSLKAGHSLFTCNMDGGDLKRITFNPHTYFAASILKDGRIVAISRQVYPDQKEASFMVMRPDGTKSELFYPGIEGNELFSNACETNSGQIVFIESGKGSPGRGNIVSIRYNRPLNSIVELSSGDGGDFRSVFVLKSGQLLVTCRHDDNEKYSLFEFDPVNMKLGSQLYSSSENDIIEAVEVTVHEKPKNLPSEVDPGVKTGLLLCQDINVTGMKSPEPEYSSHAADRIEIIGIDSSLGIVQVEKDGSFYLRVSADMPFRLRTMDSAGRTVNGPGSWYWIRPNERRGCVGCHEDQEMVPANRYASAVSKQPVAVPVHLTGIKEKEVELE